jgi:hypothetical protein
MHGINLAHQLIVTMTFGDDIVRSSWLLCIGRVIVLDEVDNFHNFSKIVSCVFRKHKSHYIHEINMAYQLIVAVIIGDVMITFSRLLRVGHIISLDKVDNVHNLPKIVSCVFRKHQRHYIHCVNFACQLIVAVTIGDIMVRPGKLLHVGHVIVLAEVDNLHDLSKIVS